MSEQKVVDRGYWLEAAPELKAHPAVGLERVGTQVIAKPVATDPGTLLNTYIRNEIVYACVEIKRSALQDPRLIVEERQNDGSYAEVPGHPLRRLWMRPLEGYDEASMLGTMSASMDLVGWFAAEKVRSRSGALVGINPLNPALLTRYNDKQNQQIGYTWKQGSTTVPFLYDDLLLRLPPNWASAAPAAVAAGATDADTAQTDFIRAFFNNGAQPGGILKVKGRLDQERADALASKWAQKYGRRGDGQHRPAVLDDDADYERTGSMLNELDSESIRSLTESRICMAFGVPPLIIYAYVGLLRATYSNLKEAWASFWDSKLSPDLKAWRSWLTWNVLPEFESEERIYSEAVRLRWDLSQVAALQDDVEAVSARAERAFRAGGITLNEYRARIGEQPDPTGGYYVRSLAVMPISFGATADEAQETITETRSQPAPPRRAVKAAPRSIERQMQQDVEAYLVNQYEAAARAVEAMA